MKLSYLITFVSLFISVSSKAQNTYPSSGNVGIGTSSPTSGLTIQTEGSNGTDGALFLVNGVNSGFGGFATLAGIKTTAGDGGQYNFLKLQNAGGTKFLINGAGNVGIGTASPQTKLDVNGGIAASGESRFYLNTYTDPFAGTGFAIKIGSSGIAVNGQSVFNNGISVGTSNLPTGYQFAVNGSAIATSMTVKIYANWPDYVFKKDYQLPSLTHVKAYIDQNHHLPEIPSEADVAKDGVNLGEMNKLLLKKVEELTLYLIEKDKVQKTLEVTNQKNSEQIDQLKKQMEILSTSLKILILKLK